MQKIKIQKLLLIAILVGLALPLISFAGSYMAGTTKVDYTGLVPCGKAAAGPGESPEVTIPCQFCHFFVMFGGLLNFLILDITLPAAILLLVIGGAMFVFAAGNPGTIKKGQSIMTSVAIGLVIIFVAYLAVGAFLSFIGLADWTLAIYQDWNTGFFQFNCPITI
jgi:hypothetical protein